MCFLCIDSNDIVWFGLCMVDEFIFIFKVGKEKDVFIMYCECGIFVEFGKDKIWVIGKMKVIIIYCFKFFF